MHIELQMLICFVIRTIISLGNSITCVVMKGAIVQCAELIRVWFGLLKE